MGNGQWALGIKEAAVSDAILIRFFPCPMSHAPSPLPIINCYNVLQPKVHHDGDNHYVPKNQVLRALKILNH